MITFAKDVITNARDNGAANNANAVKVAADKPFILVWNERTIGSGTQPSSHSSAELMETSSVLQTKTTMMMLLALMEMED